ncbi:hypothetical protein [Chromobacterium subtsugae]|uniref:hypothetical protein n=1 Tax=Chromobacterium subtsugae TaxID=251747 RepID=UPI000A6D6DFD|nr:hypothetical protein [Chromobacterium subtsugae]
MAAATGMFKQREGVEDFVGVQSRTRRLYVTEGSVHLYSSQPFALSPADLYDARTDAQFRQIIADCNIYVVGSRERILIQPERFTFADNILHGLFVVRRPSGLVHIPFRWNLAATWSCNGDSVKGVCVLASGTHLIVDTQHGPMRVPAHFVVANAESDLNYEDCDLEVIYVGQGIGRSQRRTALDRLLRHATLQRILAEATTYRPGSEVLLLLYRFEHCRIFMSTGGDLQADPQSTVEEERAHLERMRTFTLSRHAKVALAEAALIRHFQPHYNVQLRDTNFAAPKRIKVLEQLLQKDISGLMVEIASANIRSRLRSASASPSDLTELFDPEALSGERLESDDMRQQWADDVKLMAHTQRANFPLTTPEERDTFLHGVIWNGETERRKFM